MGFNISNNSLQETCFILAIVGVVVSIVAVALRFVAVRRANRKPSWEDWFSVLAVFFFILYVIPLLYRKLCYPLVCTLTVLTAFSSLVRNERQYQVDKRGSRTYKKGMYPLRINIGFLLIACP